MAVVDPAFVSVPGYSFPSGRQQGYQVTNAGPVFGTLDPNRGFIPANTALTPQLRQQILGQYAPGGTTQPTSFEFAGAHAPASAGLAPSTPGPQQTVLNDLLLGLLGQGPKGSPVGMNLFNIATNKVPPAVLQRFQQNLDREKAAITESFGRGGARFGTDLADTLGRTSGEALVNLEAMTADRALQAIGQILGVGGVTSGFEFQRGENALDRALQEFLGSRSGDPLTLALLSGLLGAV